MVLFPSTTTTTTDLLSVIHKVANGEVTEVVILQFQSSLVSIHTSKVTKPIYSVTQVTVIISEIQWSQANRQHMCNPHYNNASTLRRISLWLWSALKQPITALTSIQLLIELTASTPRLLVPVCPLLFLRKVFKWHRQEKLLYAADLTGSVMFIHILYESK